ncbi:MAG TPA: hypothetical protein VFU29_21930 [Chitinophagaceae bacterium]|nr:hypothetical protein [Chitinophagaceae bacterium]
MLVTKKYFFSFMFYGLISVVASYGQKPIDVAESSIKVGIKAEEEVYFGFAEGDQLIFSFEETGGKEMKEVEIVEMPSSSKFLEFKTSKIENKTINVTRTGIYKFRFANGALLPRVCKYKIQRIPAGPATQNFNSTVYFDEYNDTTYTNEVETFIDRSDTVISNFQDRTIKVNPLKATASSKTTFNFVLPENTVSWSYYVCADQVGQQVYQEATKSLIASSPSVIEKFPKYGPLAAVALNAPSYLTKLDTGQHINFWIVEEDNAELFQNGEQFRFIKKGRGVNEFSRMEPGDRAFNFCFHNDNKDTPVTVIVKITAILINEKFSSEPVRKMHVTTKKGMHLKN